jgi:hypothetical protein
MSTLSIGLVYLKYHNQSRESIYFRGVRKICKFFGNQIVKFISLLCPRKRTGRSSEQGIIKLIKRKIDENSKQWHMVFNEVLWEYRIACHGATKVSPYQLVYGHDVVLPWELKTGSRRTSLQDQLSVDDYSTMMKE